MKDHKIYKEIFAHRGFHWKYPENSIPSFEQAIKQKFSIEVDIRRLKCGTIVCSHDRYMSRLYSIPGKISDKTFDEIKDYRILKSECTIPTINDLLDLVKGKVSILLEVKGFVSDEYLEDLKKLLDNYKGQIYFHCINLLTFLNCKKIWGSDVFFILNPFRKRIEFIKGLHYKKFFSVPTLDDIIVEVEDNTKTIIRKIWKTFNRYTSRINDKHFLISYKGEKYQIHHRANIDINFKESSREGILKCISLDKPIELDYTPYNGKIICYHDDTITNKFGQKSSPNEKLELDESLTYEETIKIVNGKVPLVLDLKFSGIFVNNFMIKIMKPLENYNGEFSIQSYNPFILKWLMKHHPEVIRGQICFSFKEYRRTNKFVYKILNPLFAYIGKPDYILYDLDKSVATLTNFQKIIGIWVIGYTAFCNEDIDEFSSYFDNIVVEGDFYKNKRK